jgi:cation transport ATPase
MGAMDEERKEAEERLRTSLDYLAAEGFNADGWVGDSDPVLALEDAIAQFEFRTLIVATHRDAEQAFAEEDLAPHAAGRLATDVVHVVIDGDERHSLSEVEEVEAAPEVEARMDRRAMRTRRDLLALGVGVLGTVVLGVLLFGADGVRNGGPQGVIQALIGAGVFFLTFWGGAQVLFGEAVNRRRGATGRVATTILVAVPIAVIVSVILTVA